MSFVFDALPAIIGTAAVGAGETAAVGETAGALSAAAAGAGTAATAASGLGTAASIFQGLSLAGTVAGGLMSATGQMQSANATRTAALYQAQVAQNNATIANQNAAWATGAGQAQTAASGLQTRAQVGGIKAAEAAAGVDVGSGSALDVRSSARDLGELAALTLRSNAARQAYGFTTQSQSDTAEAALEKQLAGQAIPAGEIGAASTLLSTAGRVGSSLATWNAEGSGGTPGGSSLVSSAKAVSPTYSSWQNPAGSTGALLA
ncbi:MAG TPA: hypothetical protein VNG33_06735 [Polyangiaceae bacterium]|nr:hypothetical protein [Polyangiaceae bacterium]